MSETLDILRSVNVETNSAIPHHVQLARQLEHLIRTGRLKTGQKLPATTALVNLWGLNITRVQKAMEIVVMNGLLKRFPRRGTFVSALSITPSMGILVGPDLLPEEGHWQRILTFTLRNEIKDRGFIPRIYDAIRLPDTEEGKRSFLELKYDLQHHQFLGFAQVLGTMPRAVADILPDGCPTVSFGSHKPSVDIHIDFDHFTTTAVDHLAGLGCRSIAYIFSTVGEDGDEGHVRSFVERMLFQGLEVHPLATVRGDSLMSKKLEGPHTVDRACYAGMKILYQQWRAGNFHPDAIIISDDVMTRGIIPALVEELRDAGSMPKFLILANDGVEHFYPEPVIRYSLPTEIIVRRLLGRLLTTIAGEPVPAAPKVIQGRIIGCFR